MCIETDDANVENKIQKTNIWEGKEGIEQRRREPDGNREIHIGLSSFNHLFFIQSVCNNPGGQILKC